MGNYDFENTTKDFLLRTVNMLSKYTSLAID